MTTPGATVAGVGYVLKGRDVVSIGKVVDAGSSQVGVALSRGGAEKNYAFLDANEDAVLALSHQGGLMLAVADAHSGSTAGEIALDWLMDHCTELFFPMSLNDWAARTKRCFSAIDLAICGQNESSGFQSQTTLVVAMILPDKRQMYYAGLGDSHLMAFRDEDPQWLLGQAGNQEQFLGNSLQKERVVQAQLRTGVTKLAPQTAVTLATDGLSTPGIGFNAPLVAVGEVVSKARSQDARKLARQIATAVCQTQAHNASGDNIGIAVALI